MSGDPRAARGGRSSFRGPPRERSAITGYRWRTVKELHAGADAIFRVGLADPVGTLSRPGAPTHPARLPLMLTPEAVSA